MPTAAAARVTAVIPTWNRRDLLLNLFQSLGAQTRPFNEIIVVDNGSTDGSAEFAERAGAKVLRLGRNAGFAAAVNRGIEAAGTDWVAILNNDVTLEPDWLEKLLTAPEDAWFASGKILRTSDPNLVDGTFDEISRGACASRCGSGKPDGPAWNQPRRIRVAPMTAAAISFACPKPPSHRASAACWSLAPARPNIRTAPSRAQRQASSIRKRSGRR